VWEKGVREQQVYLPASARWRDAWRPDRVHDGGQTISVRAETHQIPLFVREGASLNLGDLEQEWRDAQTIARAKPDLATLERSVNEWFAKNGGAAQKSN
jgi:alpha-glucosidase (family GH31 glycosyl hydrolase)